MSRRRTTRPPRNRKSPARDSEAPQAQPVTTVTVTPPALDADDAVARSRAGDELAALDAAWDEA
jgi:hypothetical protein